MRQLLNIELTDELNQTFSDYFNQKTILMNPRTGTVQTLELWQTENELEHPEPFIEKELFEVKWINGQWEKVN